MKVKIRRKQDNRNPKKVWLIKHYDDGHYAVNQEVDGKVLYKRYQRMTRKQIKSVFQIKENER